MQQSLCIAFLEGRIVGACGITVYDLPVVGDGALEIACIEGAVSQSVERVGIGGVSSRYPVNVAHEMLRRLVVEMKCEHGVAV